MARGPKFQIRFPPRRRAARGRGGPLGVWGWALQREGEVAGHPGDLWTISTGLCGGRPCKQEIFVAALLFLYFYEVGLSTECGNVKPINPFFLFHSLFWGGVL